MKPNHRLGLMAGLLAMTGLAGFGRPSPAPIFTPPPDPEPDPESLPSVPAGAILIPEFAAVAEHCLPPISINVRAPHPAEAAAAAKRKRRALRKNSNYAVTNPLVKNEGRRN